MKEEREKTKNQKASRSTEREGKLLVQRGHDHVYRKQIAQDLGSTTTENQN